MGSAEWFDDFASRSEPAGKYWLALNRIDRLLSTLANLAPMGGMIAAAKKRTCAEVFAELAEVARKHGKEVDRMLMPKALVPMKYTPRVRWSAKDRCYVGTCAELFFGGVHGTNRSHVALELRKAIEQHLKLREVESPSPTAPSGQSPKSMPPSKTLPPA